jgi:tetratricopeptide (TPR) repeat protein
MLRSFVALSLLYTFTAAAVVPAVAWADPDPSALASAKTHYAAGQAAFGSGDYTTAVTEWKTADQIAPAPLLDYNIGLAYERMGHFKAASNYYGKYLAEAPQAQNTAEVKDRIAACEAATTPDDTDTGDEPVAAPAPAAVPAAPTPAAPTAVTPSASAPPAPAAPDGTASTPIPPPEATNAPPPPPSSYAQNGDQGQSSEDEPVYDHWWFWAVLGGGALILVLSAAHDGNHNTVSTGVAPLPVEPGGATLYRF